MDGGNDEGASKSAKISHSAHPGSSPRGSSSAATGGAGSASAAAGGGGPGAPQMEVDAPAAAGMGNNPGTSGGGGSSSAAAAAAQPYHKMYPGAIPEGPKIIAIYNYKGGVAKTTTCMNLAVAMAKQGKRVLLVDADPQCNLTSYIRGREESVPVDDEDEPDTHGKGDPKSTGGGVQEEKKKEEEDDWADAEIVQGGNHAADQRDGLLELRLPTFPLYPDAKLEEMARGVATSLSTHRQTIFTVVKALKERASFGEIETYQCYNRPGLQTIHLIRGDPSLARYTNMLEEAQSLSDDGWSSAKVQAIGAFRRAVVLAAEKVKADVILIDMAPSSETMNKVIAMTSDYILPPSFADKLSFSSADTLLRVVLPSWFKWHDETLKKQDGMRQDLGTDVLPFLLPRRCPLVLPFLVSGIKLLTPPIGNPRVKALLKMKSIWAKCLDNVVKDVMRDNKIKPSKLISDISFSPFIPCNTSNDGAQPGQGNQAPKLHHVMTLIPECSTLLDIAAQLETNVLLLNQQDYRQINRRVWESESARINKLNECYGVLARELIRLPGFALGS